MVQIPENSWYANMMKLAADLPEKYKDTSTFPEMDLGDTAVGVVPDGLRPMLMSAWFLKDQVRERENKIDFIVAKARVQNEEPNQEEIDQLSQDMAWDQVQSRTLMSLFWTELKHALGLKENAIKLCKDFQVVTYDHRASALGRLLGLSSIGLDID